MKVDSTVAGIESGIYDVSPRKNAKNPPLNEVWLRLIGTDPDVRIVANSRFETKRLTRKNLLRVFYLDEGRVDDAESIVEPSHRYMENTLFLSALLYLFTGRTFTETDAQEKSEIKNARRKAVKDYVNRKIQDAAARKAELGEKLHLFDGIDIDAQIEEATENRPGAGREPADTLVHIIRRAADRRMQCAAEQVQPAIRSIQGGYPEAIAHSGGRGIIRRHKSASALPIL